MCATKKTSWAKISWKKTDFFSLVAQKHNHKSLFDDKDIYEGEKEFRQQWRRFLSCNVMLTLAYDNTATLKNINLKRDECKWSLKVTKYHKGHAQRRNNRDLNYSSHHFLNLCSLYSVEMKENIIQLCGELIVEETHLAAIWVANSMCRVHSPSAAPQREREGTQWHKNEEKKVSRRYQAIFFLFHFIATDFPGLLDYVVFFCSLSPFSMTKAPREAIATTSKKRRQR